MPESRNEVIDLFRYATKNKIGLLYLETLKKRGKLERFGLESEYQRECEKHDEHLLTARRVSKLFNAHNIDYAIFKSTMPYPAVPNDVDVIHFGSDKEFKKTVEIMLNAGYERIEDVSSPVEFEVHDARHSHHIGSHTKDVYDIDFYRKVAANYIPYLNKGKLAKYTAETNVLGEGVKILQPEADLIAIIAHSLVEQLCTLFVYYATIYYLAEMGSNGVSNLLRLAGDHNVTVATRAHCSVVAALHQSAHGFTPGVLEQILTKLGGSEKKEVRNLFKRDFKMPHRYNWPTVIRALLERIRDGEFRAGALRLAMSLLNPKFLRYIIWQLAWRHRRETY